MKKVLYGAVVLLFAAGCASDGDLVKEDSLLMDAANEAYANKRFTMATDRYRRLMDGHPDSPHRKLALLGLADSLYKEKKYFEAILYYERFVELYPLDRQTPRARFYLAASYYKDAFDPDRDQSNTGKALTYFDDFMEKHPDHDLAPYARRMRTEMEESISESHLEIARFYRRTRKNQSAILRLEDFMKTYPGSPSIPEAMYLLGGAYYEEEAYRKAAEVFISLISKYPESEFSVKAKALAENIKLKK